MFKNKRNLAVIAILAAFVAIVAVYFVFLRPMLSGSGTTSAASAPTAAPPSPAAAPLAAPGAARLAADPKIPARPMPMGLKPMGMKGKLAKAPAGKAAAKVKKNAPLLAKGPQKGKPAKNQVASATVGAPVNPRPDPFVIPGVKAYVPPKPPVSSMVPTQIVTNWHPAPVIPPRLPVASGLGGTQVASLPEDRVAGIMMNNGVYAIVDSGGQSQVVQPGDTLPGGEQVVSIQSDSVTFKTPEDQTVSLPISAGESPAGPEYGGGFAGGYPGYGGPGGGLAGYGGGPGRRRGME